MYLIYGAVDKEVMFLPIYLLISIWTASGIAALVDWMTATIENLGTDMANLLVNGLLLVIVALGVIADWSTVSLHDDRRAYDFATKVLEEVGPSTTIVSHWATASVFDYLRIVEGQRPDVTSFNADFYFLGVQEACAPISTQRLIDNGWIQWLAGLSEEGRLCFIEPLNDLPDGYDWQKKGSCWELRPEGGQ
jgi:hypothetical protein